MSAAAFLALLEAGDVDGLWRAWSRVAPHLPQPATRDLAEITMHVARTQNASVTLKARRWSHQWLLERGLPSQLPDEFLPRPERPQIVEGVGIVVKTKNPFMQPVADEVRKAMEGAVEEAYADGRTSPLFVRQRMNEARDKAYRALLGR